MNILKKPTILIYSLIFAVFLLSGFFSTVLGGVTFAPQSAEAATFKNANELNLPATENYTENSYFLAGQSTIFGNFEKDLFIVAGNSVFEGTVNGDLFVIGGNVTVSGKVLGDLRVIGGEVFVKGEVENDLVVIGGKVHLEENANLKGHTLLVGAETIIASSINHPAKIISAKTLINKDVNSEIEVTTQNFILGSSGKINNGITYYAPMRIVEEPGSVMQGNISFNQISPLQDTGLIKKTIINFMTFWLILKFITTLLLAFILAYIFRVFTKKIVDLSLDSFGKSLLVGLAATFVAPLIIVFLLISLVAMPIGFLALILFIALMIIVPAISGIIAGALIRKLFNKKDYYIIDFSTVAIGVVTLTFISFVPFFGDITKMLLNFVAIGAVARYSYKMIFEVNKISN